MVGGVEGLISRWFTFPVLQWLRKLFFRLSQLRWAYGSSERNCWNPGFKRKRVDHLSRLRVDSWKIHERSMISRAIYSLRFEVSCREVRAGDCLGNLEQAELPTSTPARSTRSQTSFNKGSLYDLMLVSGIYDVILGSILHDLTDEIAKK